MEEVCSTPPSELAKRLHVIGWESLIRLSTECIEANMVDSWTRQQALEKLHYFHTSRAAIGLLAAKRPAASPYA